MTRRPRARPLVSCCVIQGNLTYKLIYNNILNFRRHQKNPFQKQVDCNMFLYLSMQRRTRVWSGNQEWWLGLEPEVNCGEKMPKGDQIWSIVMVKTCQRDIVYKRVITWRYGQWWWWKPVEQPATRQAVSAVATLVGVVDIPFLIFFFLNWWAYLFKFCFKLVDIPFKLCFKFLDMLF